MSSSDRDLLFILLQFLEEEGFKESARKLEEESGIFFNMLHFEELVKKGEWDEVEKYLLGFTTLDENTFSNEVFFQIRKQKYLEAIDRKDIKKAINILNSELKVFAREDNDLYKEMAMLLTLENIREPGSERNNMIDKLKNAIESNPAFHDALNSPAVEASRLRVLINQSLNWQHHHCQKPNPKPEIMTLLVDHRCEESQLNGGQVLPPVTNQLTVDAPMPGGFPPLQADGVNNMPVNILHVGYGNQSQGQSSGSSDDIPMTVVMTLNQGSAVRSMDFHPVQHSLLLVGTSIGEIIIWELRTRTRLAKRSFGIWDHRACTLGLQSALRNDPPASVNRVLWSPHGSVFVVAYSKGLVHVYTYYGNLRNHLEIEAHEGSVNDIAFKNLNYRLYIITCGEDKLIKMWDASTGTKKYTFEGHESSVCSVCPHQIGNIQFFFSVATDGKIKVWPYFDTIRGKTYYLQVNNMPVNILHVGYGNQSQGQSSGSSDDIPMTVVMTLNQGSAVRSMDFHPVQHSLLLVGTSIGEIIIWELRTRTRLAKRSFGIWDHRACTLGLQSALRNDPPASVNRVLWSPHGSVFVVAYSKGLVHVYTYYGNLRNHLEIEAHEGSVNDIAFKNLNYRLYIITCGEDKLIKMWDASTGTKKYTFEGHESSVCSVCPHQIGNIQFFFSVATDGKIKVWPYFDTIRGVDYPAQGHSLTTMLCSSDGKRLFSCGTDMEGVSYLRELNDNSVTIKREYIGLGGQTTEAVKFDTAKNRFLAAGDDFTVKFWDMDDENLFTTTDAGGALPCRPCLRFNKEGNLLAVSTSENGIKILANADGFRLLRA
ncbi:protein TPR3-like [Ipomoea triloba]|uniref:protein TPR3-like n=1 Tax=Ipomoea triloba TaxID=35885 RepID=UPI00125E99F4|nr:protein TPR3-like [Ipomoea triloba]